MADIKVRVGQQNSIKVLSSVSGAAGGRAVFADNVIGGIASVTNLSVSGISTFNSSAQFRSSVSILGDLSITGSFAVGLLTVININSNNLKVSGVSTFVGLSTFANDVYVGQGFYYKNYNAYGMPYFNPTGLIVSTQSPQNGITSSNYLMTTDDNGIPSWTSVIDGGIY
jgi:hypothetical protein